MQQQLLHFSLAAVAITALGRDLRVAAHRDPEELVRPAQGGADVHRSAAVQPVFPRRLHPGLDAERRRLREGEAHAERFFEAVVHTGAPVPEQGALPADVEREEHAVELQVGQQPALELEAVEAQRDAPHAASREGGAGGAPGRPSPEVADLAFHALGEVGAGEVGVDGQHGLEVLRDPVRPPEAALEEHEVIAAGDARREPQLELALAAVLSLARPREGEVARRGDPHGAGEQKKEQRPTHHGPLL